MNLLESRFGGKAVSDKHRIELRNRRHRQNETLQSLHADIRRLAALAFPNVQPQMREEITCDHFLDALGDPDFALKIRERHPADLDSALQIAYNLKYGQPMQGFENPESWREKTEKADVFEKSRTKSLIL